MQAVHELKQNKLRLEECKTFLEEFKLGIITKDEYHAAITGLKRGSTGCITSMGFTFFPSTYLCVTLLITIFVAH